MDTNFITARHLLASFSLALAAAAEVLGEQANKIEEIGFDSGATATQNFVAPAAAITNVESTPTITPAAIAAAELDKDGMPWDERIHAGTKTKTAAGIWTKRKGVDDAVREAVTAELRAQYPAPAAPAAPAAPVAPAVPTITPPAPPVVAQTSYTKLVDWLAKNTGEGKYLNAEYVNSVFASNNTSIAALAGNDEMAEQFLSAFRNIMAQAGIAEV